VCGDWVGDLETLWPWFDSAGVKIANAFDILDVKVGVEVRGDDTASEQMWSYIGHRISFESGTSLSEYVMSNKYGKKRKLATGIMYCLIYFASYKCASGARL
jgi:hypothetical protein